MKLPAAGRVHERITAIATISYPAYIVRGEMKSVMIDSGVNLLGPRYLASLAKEDGDRRSPDYLFLTHSHYDHVGSADYLRRHLPGLKLGAHQRTAKLVRKPSALATMNRLSLSHTELLSDDAAGEDLTLHPFDIDILLGTGDEIDLGGLTCRVYEVPGHTRDSLAFFFPEIGALFPGDACGVLRTGKNNLLQVEFVASYQDYVDSLTLMATLEPDIVCPAHNWVLTGNDARRFLESSRAETFRYRALIESYLDAANGDVDEAIRTMAQVEYDGEDGSLPPSAAYLENLTAQVRHIAEIRTEKKEEPCNAPI